MLPVVGLGLVVLGALGATVTQRRLEAARRGRWIPLAVLPHGVLIGAGAAFVRGWALPTAMALGGVAVPLVAVASRLLQVRRQRRR